MGRAARRKTSESFAQHFVSLDALRGAAALALWPRNADRVAALTALSHGFANPVLGSEGREPTTAPEWRSWIASPRSKDIRRIVRNGVYDAPPIVQSAILGERYILLTGFLHDADLHLRLWTEALYAALGARPGDEVIAETLELLLSACVVSDQVADEAGLADCTRWPDHELAGRIGVPDGETFERLCSALVVEGDDGLDPLLRSPELTSEDAWRFPLVRWSDGRLLLAAPADLLRAALVHAAQRVAESPAATIVRDHLRQGALRTLRIIAAGQDWEVEQESARGVLARIDTDKLVAIEVALDLDGGRPTGLVRDQGADLEEPLARLHTLRARYPQTIVGLVVHLGDGRPVHWTLPDPEAPFGPWFAGLADMRLIGDAFRRDQLGLWRQLRCLPPPPWPEGASLTDMVGVARRFEDYPVPGHGDESVSLDGTEFLHQRARLMSARHPAPAPPDGAMTTVTRWGGTPDHHVFSREIDSPDGALLIRASGRFVWVAPAQPAPARSLESTLVQMTSFWITRMLDAGWLLHPEAKELAISITVDFVDLAGPLLSVAEQPGGVRLHVGPGFVHVLCRGDNSADRMLVQALTSWWLPAESPAAESLLDAVAPAGDGTFTMWPQPWDRLRGASPEPPALIPAGVRRRIEVETASNFVAQDHVVVVQGNEVLSRLDDVVGAVVTRLDQSIDALQPEAVLELVRLHEQALVQEQREEVSLPARAAIPDAAERLGDREATAVRSIALRGLVERATARPPIGSEPVSRERLTDLRAGAEALVEWGSARDACRAGVANICLIASPMIGIRVVAEGPGPEAFSAAIDQQTAAAPERMREEHQDWWTAEPAPEPVLTLDQPIELENHLWRAVDSAMLDSWGFRWEELVRVLRALSLSAENESDFTSAAIPEQLARDLTEQTRIASDRIHALLSDLVLTPEPGYDPRERPHKPWGVNRDRSYVRRPLVELPGGGLTWSSVHVLRTGRYLRSLCLHNRLPSTGPLRAAVGKLSQSIDAAFEAEVGRRARTSGWQTLEDCKRLGGLRLERAQGQDIGNLDVLAFRAATAEVLLLEAKRLHPALGAHALEREAAEMENYVSKHDERITWVRSHPERLVREIGVPGFRRPWSVSGALVVDQPLVGAHYAALGMPVWTIDELSSHLAPAATEDA